MRHLADALLEFAGGERPKPIGGNLAGEMRHLEKRLVEFVLNLPFDDVADVSEVEHHLVEDDAIRRAVAPGAAQPDGEHAQSNEC